MKATGLVLDPEVSVDVEPDEFYDRSRFGNNGVSTDITWVQLPSGLWVMDFSNATAEVDLGSDASLENFSAMSVFMWIRASAFTGAERWFIDACRYVGSGGFVIRLEAATNQLTPMISNTVAAAAFHTYDSTPDTWQLVGFTYDGAWVRYYRDGVDVGGADALVGTIGCSAHNWFLGRRSTGASPYDGLLGPVRVHTYALSPGQILKHYEAERRLFGV